jgi:hypothetical protein
MNNDKQSRSKQPVQRLHPLPPAHKKQPAGDVLTYQDSKGRDLEPDEGDYDDAWPSRLPNSSIRYMQPYQGNTRYQVHPDQVQSIPRRKSAVSPQPGQRTTENIPAIPVGKKRDFRAHAVIWVGLGMILMFLGWTGLQALSSWWQMSQLDALYGRPRTAQYDVVVGHNDNPDHKTHIIALNLKSRVVIIELPGGDSTKAKIYQGPFLYGQDSDLAPVTLTFRDVNGDGLLDMVITVQGAQIIYLNKQGQFVPQSH